MINNGTNDFLFSKTNEQRYCSIFRFRHFFSNEKVSSECRKECIILLIDSTCILFVLDSFFEQIHCNSYQKTDATTNTSSRRELSKTKLYDNLRSMVQKYVAAERIKQSTTFIKMSFSNKI